MSHSEGVVMRNWILIGLMIILTSCASLQKSCRHTQSNIVGLNRIVTLYDVNGKIIKTWEGKFKVEISGGTASFIDENNKEVKISGTYVIEEK